MLSLVNKIKIWFFLLPILGIGVFFGVVLPEQIPQEHQLKAPDFKIVDSADYTEYKKLPNGNVIEIPSKKYVYYEDELITAKDGEDIGLRTNFSWTKTSGIGQNGTELGKVYKIGDKDFENREIKVSAGVTFIKMLDGSWRNAGVGTTTKDAFDKQFNAVS